MMYKIIPLRNSCFENEILYLENQSRRGWKLKKRGNVWYTFEKTSVESLRYEVDVYNHLEENFDSDWKRLFKRDIGNKRQSVMYYYSEGNSRLISDEGWKIAYYEARCTLWWWSWFIFLLILVFFTFSLYYVLFNFVILMSMLIFSLILFVFSVKKYTIYQKAETDIRSKLGKNVIIGKRYYISFNNITSKQLKKIEPLLASMGILEQGEAEYKYILRSSLQKAEIIREIIAELHIEKENIVVIEPGEFIVGI